jgi:hypothetical protein
MMRSQVSDGIMFDPIGQPVFANRERAIGSLDAALRSG